MDIDGIKDRLTKKVGPLPLWLWAVIIVGVGYVGYTVVKSRTPSTADADGYDTAADTGDSETLAGYTSDFPNEGSSSGGLSTGSGGSQYTTSPGNLVAQDNGALGDRYSSDMLGNVRYTIDNPLPVSIEGVNPNLYTGTPYTAAQPQATTTAQAPPPPNNNAERARLQAALDQALAQSVSNNAERKAARNAYDNAKGAQKSALAVRVSAAEIASDASDAQVGTLRAQLAAL